MKSIAPDRSPVVAFSVTGAGDTLQAVGPLPLGSRIRGVWMCFSDLSGAGAAFQLVVSAGFGSEPAGTLAALRSGRVIYDAVTIGFALGIPVFIPLGLVVEEPGRVFSSSFTKAGATSAVGYLALEMEPPV